MEMEKTLNQNNNNFQQQTIQSNVDSNQTQQFDNTNFSNNFHFLNNNKVKTLPRYLTNVSEDYLNAYFGMTANKKEVKNPFSSSSDNSLITDDQRRVYNEFLAKQKILKTPNQSVKSRLENTDNLNNLYYEYYLYSDHNNNFCNNYKEGAYNVDGFFVASNNKLNRTNNSNIKTEQEKYINNLYTPNNQNNYYYQTSEQENSSQNNFINNQLNQTNNQGNLNYKVGQHLLRINKDIEEQDYRQRVYKRYFQNN
jgi:hypothetical protein